MNKQKIFFLLPSLAVGGAERVIVTLANKLSVDTPVYLAVIRMRGELINELSPDVNIIDLKGQIIWLFTLPFYLQKFKPTSILSTFWDVNFILSFLKFSFPSKTLIIFREPVFPSAAIMHSKLSLLTRFYYKCLYKSADHVIVLSHSMRNDLNECTDHNQVSVIYNTVDFPLNKITEKKSNDEFRLITCGRLTRQKGYDQLLKAFARLIQENEKMSPWHYRGRK